MLEESAPRFNIYAGDKDVGGIDLIPYKSEGLRVENADIHIMRGYLFEDVIFREVRITLNTEDAEDADQGTMRKMKNSFVFANGPFNVVDLQYNVE